MDQNLFVTSPGPTSTTREKPDSPSSDVPFAFFFSHAKIQEGLSDPPKLLATINSMGQFLIVIDQNDCIEFMNQPLMTLLGCDAVGQSCHDILHGRFEPCPGCLPSDDTREDPGRPHVIQSSSDGRTYAVKSSTLYHLDGTCSTQAVFCDITPVPGRPADQPDCRVEPEVIARFDRQGRFISVSEGLLAQTRRSREAFLGHRFAEIWDEPVLVEAWQMQINRVFETGRQQELDYTYREGNGSCRFQCRLVPQGDPARPAETLTVVARDFIETDQLKNQVRALFEQTNFFLSHTNDGINIMRYDTRTRARQLVMANDRFVDMVGRHRSELLACENINVWFQPDGDPAMWEKWHQRILANQPFYGTGRWDRPDHKENFIEWTAVPFDHEGQKLIVGIDRDITRRRRIEGALQESERHYRALFERSAMLIVLLDPTTLQLVDYNQRLTEAINHPDLDLNRVTFGALCDNYQSPELQELLEPCLDGQDVEFEWQFRNDQDGQRIARVQATAIDYDDQPLILCTAYDITRHKQSEDQLRISETRYRAISELAAHYAYAMRIDEDQVFHAEWVTDGFEKITGYTMEQTEQAGGWRTLIYPPDLERIGDRRERLIKGLCDERIFRIQTDRGKLRWVQDFARPVWSQSHQRVTHIYGAARDITEEYEAREKIAFQANLLDQIGDYIIATDMDGQITYMNEAIVRDYGYNREDLIGRHVEVLNQEERGKQFQHEIVHTVQRDGQWFGQIWNTTKDGREVCLQTRIWTFTDQSGQPCGMCSVSNDITEQKRIQAAVEQRVRELKCLYGMSELSDRHGEDLQAIIEGTARLLVSAMRKPEHAIARIRYRDKTVCHPPSQTRWTIHRFLTVEEESVGEVRIGYAPEALVDEGYPFSEDELMLLDNVTDRLGNIIQAVELKHRLEVERTALEESNIGMKQLIANIQQEREKVGRDTQANVETLVLPLLDQLIDEVPRPYRRAMETIRENLQEVTSPFVNRFTQTFKDLSPTEVRVCQMIRRGMASKEIASVMKISAHTVNRHRENIRRKLGLTKSGENLQQYLHAFMSDEQSRD